MKVKPPGSTLPTSDEQVFARDGTLPKVVTDMAVRLAWITQRHQAEVLALLSLPFLHDVVSTEDSVQLQAAFPFMQQLRGGMTCAEFTIMLVAVWVRIEALYQRGIILPAQIVHALMTENNNPVSL